MIRSALSEQAIGNQLSAILERGQSAVQERVHENASAVQRTAINDDKKTEISAFVRRFWGGRESQLVGALGRLERLRPTLEPILESEGAPKQFVAVALIESGAQPMAVSPRQARGLWQFIPKTARQYGLSVSQGRDERIHIEASTRLRAIFGISTSGLGTGPLLSLRTMLVNGPWRRLLREAT